MAKLFDALEEQIVNGQSAVLLSIYKSTGSAPRGAGAHMLVTEAGRVFGTVGGGAVEYESELFANRLLKENTRLYSGGQCRAAIICSHLNFRSINTFPK